MDKIQKVFTDVVRQGAEIYNCSLRAMLERNPNMTTEQIKMNLEAHSQKFKEMDNISSGSLSVHIPTFKELYEMDDSEAERYYSLMSEDDFDKFLEYTANRSREEDGLSEEQVKRYTEIGKNGKRR